MNLKTAILVIDLRGLRTLKEDRRSWAPGLLQRRGAAIVFRGLPARWPPECPHPRPQRRSPDRTPSRRVTSGGFPWGLAIDHAGHVWITNTDLDGPVAEIDAAGKLVGNYNDNSFTGALTGIAIDASGNVWVGNFAGNSLVEIVGAAQGPQSFPFSGPVYPL
jgi:DNA-binding beta-propeller fold protein YncE